MKQYIIYVILIIYFLVAPAALGVGAGRRVGGGGSTGLTPQPCLLGSCRLGTDYLTE